MFGVCSQTGRLDPSFLLLSLTTAWYQLCYWLTDTTSTAHEEEEMRWTLGGSAKGCPFPSIFSEFLVPAFLSCLFLSQLCLLLYISCTCSLLPSQLQSYCFGMTSVRIQDIRKHSFQMPVFHLSKLKPKGFTLCCLGPPSSQILSLQLSDYTPENLCYFVVMVIVAFYLIYFIYS